MSNEDGSREAEAKKAEAPALTAKETIQSCLHKLLRVTLIDGRTVEGILECYDNHANMILSDATDISNKTRPFGKTIRLGTVLVPGGAAERVLAWREKYADTGEIVQRAVPRVSADTGAGAVGEDSDDEIFLVEGFDAMNVA